VRGIVADEPGLYFVGLAFLYAMSSGFLPGVGRDAEHVVKLIASGKQPTSDYAVSRQKPYGSPPTNLEVPVRNHS
jgi:hypothetical protein